MFTRKHAIALVLMFVAGSALASNFRVADQIYLPAGGHFAGSRNETWVTDVWISNVNSDAVDVSAIYSTGAGGTQTPFDKYFTLAANEKREIPDFFFAAKSAGGLALTSAPLGQVIFNGCKAGGNCDVTTCPGGSTSGVCPDFRNISVQARIYAIPSGSSSGSTYGQQMPGIPWYNFVSTDAQAAGLDKVFITGIRNTGAAFGTPGTFRTNIGLMNGSQYSSTQLLVKLFDKNGTQIGTSYTSPTLGPLGHQQLPISSMFGTFSGSTATGAYITVEQVSVLPTSGAAAAGCTGGCPSFLAYGSLIDNGSDDPTTLESQYLNPLTDAAQQCIYNLSCKGTVKLRRAVRH
jgi:hypothetical protein